MNKVMILAPHQDDELILCGSFLKELTAKAEVYVVYTTNGNYAPFVHTIRMEEALKVCTLYGINVDNVIFLGYANEYDNNGPHIYNASDEQVVYSQYGVDKTYGLPNHSEYCYKKYGIHHSYTRMNMKQDLYDVIYDIMPDVIFATDMEIHPDHKCNSLLLDEVLGDILKMHRGYAPIVLKKPGYMTSWFGENDYTRINNSAAKLRKSVVRTNGHRSVFDNPYLKWSDRIRIPVGQSARNFDKKENILYKALSLYESQNVISHFETIQNSDVVFWQRRTDSLTYRARIEVSSGESSYLNDFKIVDSSDIKRKEIESWNTDASIWRPDLSDKERRIEFFFEKEEEIAEIYIYQEYYPLSKITKAHLQIGNEKVVVEKLKDTGITKIQVTPVMTDRVVFVVDEVSNENIAPGITEIEIFKKKEPTLLFAKLMVGDNFVYDYYVKADEKVRLKVYEYWSYGITKISSIDDYDIVIKSNGGKNNITIQNGEIVGNINSKYEICINNRRYENITDTIILLPYLVEKNNSNGKMKINEMINSLAKKIINDEIGIYYGKFADKFASLSYGDNRNNMSWFVKEFIRGYICEDYKKKKHSHRKIFFLGTPDHGNLGDHAITVASYKLLYDVFGDVEIEEISILEFARKLPYLTHNIQDNDLIVLQGGGNMGNIYWRNERIRREVIVRFPKNIKVIFPETIYYENNEEGKLDFKLSKRVYKNKNTFIFAREQKSYEIMKKAYPASRVFLVPDVVCYMTAHDINNNRNCVGLCFRNDLEKGVNASIEQSIKDRLEQEELEYHYIDMMYKSKGYIGKANRKMLVYRKIDEIASYKFIITDRLHGMILSYITGTPCIVISKYNHKIQSFYETWFKDVEYIKFLYKEEELDDVIKCIGSKNACKPNTMNYKEIIRILEEWK